MGYYSQKDPRWANKKVGYGKMTFAQVGCALTSIANKLKFDGIDKTPLEINELAKKCGAFQVDMLVFPKLAEALGYKYQKQTAKPKGRQIMETNYYKKVGIPQHFVFMNESGKRIDPLDLEPSWEPNNYPAVSWRVFTKKDEAQKSTVSAPNTETAPIPKEHPKTQPEAKFEATDDSTASGDDLKDIKNEITLLKQLIAKLFNFLGL